MFVLSYKTCYVMLTLYSMLLFYVINMLTCCLSCFITCNVMLCYITCYVYVMLYNMSCFCYVI